MNPKQAPHPNRSRRRTADHAKLAADIAKVQAFIEAGLSPSDALNAFRAGLSVDDLRAVVAYAYVLEARQVARVER